MALLRLFGHPVLDRDGTRTQLGVPPKAFALLALIAANHARPLSREWLAQSLWPDTDPADARANLRRHLHLLAKALGDDVFDLTRHTARWKGAPDLAVDVVRFDVLSNTQSALAVDEYGGELCAGIYDEALEPLRARYRSQYESLLRMLIAQSCASENHSALSVWLAHAISHDPFDEAAVRQLMQLRRSHGDRAGALREFNALTQRLRSELGAEPEAETLELFSEIVGQTQECVTPNNLSGAATTFVGRERELGQLAQALRESRIVTLTGPGGIGKTRLAGRACFDLLQRFVDGIWFVELEHASGAAAIWERIADTASVSSASETVVLQHFRDRHSLIVLDTCEHVIDAVRDIAERLTNATRSTVLATSRRKIHARGERVIELGPLDIPPSDIHPDESPLRYGAYRLFLERAAMVSPAFRVDRRHLGALRDVLRRTDGLPLAIELVASRANVLTVEGMRKRLAATMRAPLRNAASARAQTINDAISWSYELLSNDQRGLFAFLSVFHGPFTIEDAERVCAQVPEAVDSLFELVDASLVAVLAGENDARYRLLETTRAFARARLLESEAVHAAFLSHAEHFAEKADELAAYSNAEYDSRINVISASIADYLAALEHCAEFGWTAISMRVMEGLHRYGLRGRYCGELLHHTLALLETDGLHARTAARLHRFVGAFAPARGLLPLAREHTELACAFYRESGDESSFMEASSALAIISFESGKYDECERRLMDVRERAERTQNAAMLFKTLGRLGALHLALRDFTRSFAELQQAATGLRQLNELHQLGYALKNLAVAAHYGGRHSEAITYTQEALALPSATADIGLRGMLLCLQGSARREIGNLREALTTQLAACALLPEMSDSAYLAECVEDLASTLCAARKHEAAARLIGYAQQLRERIGTEINPGLRDYYDQTLDRLQGALGSYFADARAAGAQLTAEAAAALVQAAAKDCLPQDSEDTTSLS